MSMSVVIYNQSWDIISTKELSTDIFAEERVNSTLVHEFVLMQLSNARMGNAHSKDRGEVSYSNRKLFKQKGTGNARPGSLKSPLRKQGWVVFGPRKEVNHTKTMNKKARRLATLSSVIMKVAAQEVIGLESFTSTVPSTKAAVSTLSKIAPNGRKNLVILPQSNDITFRSFRNIDWTKVITVDYVNPYDILTHHNVIFVGDSLEQFAQANS